MYAKEYFTWYLVFSMTTFLKKKNNNLVVLLVNVHFCT